MKKLYTVQGKNAIEIANILGGNTCGPRNTSCADQLSKAIKEGKWVNIKI